MPQPTRSQVHINRPLTNISVAFTQEDKFFVARRVFPSVPVQKQSDSYFVFPRDNWFTDEMAERAPGTESAGSGYTVTTDTYSCKVFALHKDVADQIRDNADDPLNPDKEATEYLTRKWLLKLERVWVATYFKTSVWTGSSSGGDITPGTKWDQSGSSPVRDVDTQKKAMLQKTGFMPNKMLVAPAVDTALKHNADILDRIKHTERGNITDEILSALFGMEYMVAGATYNAAKEGAAKDMQFIAGSEGAALYYANPSPALMQPSAGYVFGWTGHIGAGAYGQAMSKFRMDNLKADRVEIEAAFDTKLVASDLGVFFGDVLT